MGEAYRQRNQPCIFLTLNELQTGFEKMPFYDALRHQMQRKRASLAVRLMPFRNAPDYYLPFVRRLNSSRMPSEAPFLICIMPICSAPFTSLGSMI